MHQRQHGVEYETAEKTKSDIYREALALLNSGRVELLDHPRLHTQLLSLERRTSRAGRDSIDHGPGGHDDVANSVAGALVAAAEAQPVCGPSMIKRKIASIDPWGEPLVPVAEWDCP